MNPERLPFSLSKPRNLQEDEFYITLQAHGFTTPENEIFIYY
jgi:hypothetical protein